MAECKSVATPLDRNFKLDADSGTNACEPTQYRQLIGSLIYLTITRPDLSYQVGLLSQFIQTPRDIHLDCAKRVLRYGAAQWTAAFSTRLRCQYDSRGTPTPIGPATKPIEDPPLDLCSPSAAEAYLISTNLQTADIFTKALGTDKLWQFMTDLGLTIPDLPSLRGSTEETKKLRNNA